MYKTLYILEQDHLIVLHELTLTQAQISARFFKVQLELVLQVPQRFEEAYRFPMDTIFTINFNDDIMSELKLEVEKASGSKFAHKYDLNKSTINKLILEDV